MKISLGHILCVQEKLSPVYGWFLDGALLFGSPVPYPHLTSVSVLLSMQWSDDENTATLTVRALRCGDHLVLPPGVLPGFNTDHSKSPFTHLFKLLFIILKNNLNHCLQANMAYPFFPFIFTFSFLKNTPLFYFLAMPYGMWDLGSPTRDRTHAPCIGRTGS